MKIAATRFVTALIAITALSHACLAAAEPAAGKACGKPEGRELGSVWGRIDTALEDIEGAARSVLSADSAAVYAETVVRARRRLQYADHMHGRCWYDDRLSCGLLRAALEEAANTEALNGARGEVESSRQRLGSTANSLGASCRKLPWDLG